MTQTYDPALIVPSELPITTRARTFYSHLWSITSAKEFCKQLLILAAVPGISVKEYQAIAAVASGKPWPIPDYPYTAEDWNRDGHFSAAPGQEVTFEVYQELFNSLPPYSLPHCKRTQGYSAGFLVGESMTGDPRTGKTLYMAFGRNGDKCYYIGLLPIN